jgi:hypothetical protein
LDNVIGRGDSHIGIVRRDTESQHNIHYKSYDHGAYGG